MSSGGHGGHPLPFYDALLHVLHGAHDGGGYSPAIQIPLIGFPLAIFMFFLWQPEQTFVNFEFLLFFAPIWAPIILARYTFARYLQSKRVEFIASQKMVLVELRMPRDTRKGVHAMETVFASMANSGGESTWWKKFVLGRTRPFWSLEIVSLGGQVHFYIWVRESLRRAMESYFYAQYPGMEIVEAVDYSRLTDPSHAPYQMIAFEFGYGKSDAYPIKTYIDFGLDKSPTPEPEETVDPLAQIIETMGSIGPKEQLWMQLIIRGTKGEKFEGMKNSKGAPYTWKDAAKEEVENLRKEGVTIRSVTDPTTGEKKTVEGFNPTEGQKESIKAIEKKTGKIVYDVGIRGMYMAPDDAFQGTMGGVLAMIFRPFNSELLNGLMPQPKWSDYFKEYPWEDKGGHHQAHAMHRILELYRRRAFYYPPYRGTWNIMTTEELATLFHVPSGSVTTPSLPRIQSSTSSSPSNLPT